MNTRTRTRKESTRLRGLITTRSDNFPATGPFLKWAGGKSQLLGSFEEYFPERFQRYHEPFLGGGAVFFRLMSRQSHSFSAHLSDLNQELVNCYVQIRDNPEDLIDDLRKHRNEAEYFYQLRSLDPSKLSLTERASRLIYLNKTCFNGLYRVNSKGNFNVPFGFYKNPTTCNEANIRSCHAALQNSSIKSASFDSVLETARKGDFVYFDPPYHPLSRTSNFTSYTKSCFSAEDQERLAETFKALDRRGCLVMLSNSDCRFIRQLYADFHVETVYAIRAINCKAEGRGRISEVLVRNYQ